MSDLVTFRPNDKLLDEVAGTLLAGMDRFNEVLVQRARAKLTPGHGLLTGLMRDATRRDPAHRNGLQIEGAVGAYGVQYSLLVHQKYYQYITDTVEELQHAAAGIMIGG